MSKNLLYLFGEPGTGKITVARILQQRLGWRLFWLHDLDSVCSIVGRYPLPRLMDRVSAAVLEEMMDQQDSIIYVRPSRDRETVLKVLALAEANGYAVHPIRLIARRDTLVSRVSNREKSEHRVSSEYELNRYLDARPVTSCEVNAAVLSTDDLTAEQVADTIQQYLLDQENSYGSCRNAGAR